MNGPEFREIRITIREAGVRDPPGRGIDDEREHGAPGRGRTSGPRRTVEHEVPSLSDQVGPLPARNQVAGVDAVGLIAGSLAVLDQRWARIACACGGYLGDSENPALRQMRLRVSAGASRRHRRDGDRHSRDQSDRCRDGARSTWSTSPHQQAPTLRPAARIVTCTPQAKRRKNAATTVLPCLGNKWPAHAAISG